MIFRDLQRSKENYIHIFIAQESSSVYTSTARRVNNS